MKLFSNVKDFRVEGRCKHLLSKILGISFIAIIAGAEDYEEIVIFAKERKEWLSKIMDMTGGIPSSDTLARVFTMLNHDELKKVLTAEGREVLDTLDQKQLILDGKKIKGASPTSKGNKGLYVLNAWVSENNISVGQLKIEDKSNEITAIPILLDELEIAGAVVTIDAIGCQTEIAKKIIGKDANYLLSLKKNQKHLYEMAEEAFRDNKSESTNQTWDYGHGRYEERTCNVLTVSEIWAKEVYEPWMDLHSLVMITAKRIVNEKESIETRYYLSSEACSANYFNKLARAHWGIENKLHWHLDVTFGEDACRARNGNSSENLSLFRKLALQKISSMDDKLSLKKRRFAAGINPDYLKEILAI